MTPYETQLDPAMLHVFLTLDHNSGFLTWKDRDPAHFRNVGAHKAWHKLHAGKRAGSLSGCGYRQLTIATKNFILAFQEHRVVFAMVHGRWPENEVDHINRIRNDNRPANLRDVTRSENQKNRTMKRTKNENAQMPMVQHAI